MAQEIYIPALTLHDSAAVTEQVENYHNELGDDIILLTDIGGGAIRFAAAAFPDASLDDIYAQYNVREHEGRGPHFDIYNESIDESHPWLGVYNLAGRCTVRAAVMPKELSEQYAKLYPEADEAAYAARRHFGALVLESEATMAYSGQLQEGTGLILPQQKGGPNIVHEVVPEDPLKPGSFIKMVVPTGEVEVLADLRDEAFKPLDELLTGALSELGADSNELDGVVPLPSSDPSPRQLFDASVGGERGRGGRMD